MDILPRKNCFQNPSKLIKFVILFLCCIFTISQVAECFRKFIHPPASTHSEFILNDSVRYPCVTICRRPAFKTELFPKFGLNPYVSSLDSHLLFRNYNFSISLREFFENTTYQFPEIFGQYGYASIGYPNDPPANDERMTTTYSFHFYRGRCFTFQPLINSEIFSISGGYLFWLSHNIIDKGINEYGVSTHGFQIYLHDHNEAVTYDEDERSNFLEILDLEASEDMRVKLEIQEFGRLPTTENHCLSDANYSKSKCEEVCVNDQISKQANCTAPFLLLPEDNKLSECNNYTSLRNLISNYISPSNRMSLIENCNCPMACNFTIYKTSIINRRDMEAKNAPNSIIILYSTNLLFRMSEVLGYDWNQLLSDIGGSLGFLLGLSVISLICLCEEIFHMIFRWMFRKKNQKESDELEPNEVNNAEEINETKSVEEVKEVTTDVIASKSKPPREENIIQDEKVVHEYKNLNEFVTEYNFYKKNSDFNDVNSNINMKY